MSKKQASKHFETWGDVQTFLASVDIGNPSEPSRINRSITRLQAFQILSKGVRIYPSDEKIEWRSSHALGAANVWKEYLQ